VDTNYVCPYCRHELTDFSFCYFCSYCKINWPLVSGIPRFAKNELSYSVFRSDVAGKVTELAEQKSWQEAIDTYSNTVGTYTLGYIKNESRADWHIILPLDQNATVLDIGSGWGNIAISLSRWCKLVYCCDVNMINLRLLRARLRDRNISNVAAFQYEPNAFLHLPFRDSSIDVALLNGVLEWIGAADIEASPGRIQLEALKEIRRILKPGGALYIGIENRYSLSTLCGQRMHGELPFVGLLPRMISNLITKMITGKPHRTYIYTLFGYRRLLSRAGFVNTDFYIPYPSYHDPNYLIPLKECWIKRYWLEKLLGGRTMKYRLAQYLRMSWLPFHWLAYSYGIKCTK